MIEEGAQEKLEAVASGRENKVPHRSGRKTWRLAAIDASWRLQKFEILFFFFFFLFGQIH